IAKTGLRTTAVRIPTDLCQSWKLRPVSDFKTLLVAITDNALILVKFTTWVLFRFSEVGIKQKIKAFRHVPVDIQTKGLVFGNCFKPVLNIVEGTVFEHINNGTIFIQCDIFYAARIKPDTQLGTFRIHRQIRVNIISSNRYVIVWSVLE